MTSAIVIRGAVQLLWDAESGGYGKPPYGWSVATHDGTDEGGRAMRAGHPQQPSSFRTMATFSSTMPSLSPRCMPTLTTSAGLILS